MPHVERFRVLRGHRKLAELRRTSNSRRRQWTIQQAQLREHRRLIPVNMLVSDLARLKLNDADEDELSLTTGGRHARKHPAHVQRVREANDELFDNPII